MSHIPCQILDMTQAESVGRKRVQSCSPVPKQIKSPAVSFYCHSIYILFYNQHLRQCIIPGKPEQLTSGWIRQTSGGWHHLRKIKLILNKNVQQTVRFNSVHTKIEDKAYQLFNFYCCWLLLIFELNMNITVNADISTVTENKGMEDPIVSKNSIPVP